MGRRLKMRTVTCVRCGKLFDTTSTNAMYCPECRRITSREAQRAWQAEHHEAHLNSIVADYDTPEQRNACLTCDMPADKCTGSCRKIREM